MYYIIHLGFTRRTKNGNIRVETINQNRKRNLERNRMIPKEETISTFQKMQLYGNYLYECGYNEYDELMNMTLNEMKERFDEVTKGEK